MMNCIYETSTWTSQKKTHTPTNIPNKQKLKQQRQSQGLIVWCVCMAINNIKFISQKKKVNTLIFLLVNQMCVVTFGRKRI